MTTEAADNSASDSDRGARQQGGCMSSRLRSAAGMLVVVVAFLGVLAGCGGSSAPSPSSAAKASTTSSTGGCADVAALKASLAALTQVRPLQDGVAALQAAIANVKTSLDTAEASASCDPAAGGGPGEVGVRCGAGVGHRSEHRQSHAEGAVHRRGADPTRYRSVGAGLGVDAELPWELAKPASLGCEPGPCFTYREDHPEDRPLLDTLADMTAASVGPC